MSTNFFIVVTIILLILLFVAYGLLMWYMFNRIKQQEKIIDLSSYEINTRNPIDQSIPSALDSFISDCFTDYQLMVLIPRNELYITEVREQEIIKDLAAKVSERISPNFKERLSKYYNPDTLDKVIADKIYIAVLNYCINNNAVIKTEPESKNKG